MLSLASGSAPQAVFSSTSPQKPLCRFSLTWGDFSSDPKSLKDQTCHLLRNTIWFFIHRDKVWQEITGRQIHTSVAAPQLLTAGSKTEPRLGSSCLFHISQAQSKDVRILFSIQICQPTEKGTNTDLMCFWSKLSTDPYPSLLINKTHLRFSSLKRERIKIEVQSRGTCNNL